MMEARPRSRTAAVTGSKTIAKKYLPGFARQLGAMLSAGIPIVGALSALEEQADHKGFQSVIARARAAIENGSALSEALARFPTVFDNLFCNMVRGGETGGQLPETISRLAGFLEASAKLRKQVVSAMTYPIVILSLSLVIAVAMIIFIVPVFAGMYADFGGELPGPTQALMNLSDFLVHRGWLLALVLAGLAVFFKHWKKTPSGRLALDTLKLRLPIAGDLIRKLITSRFARTLGEMTRCGVPILTSMEITAGATNNMVAEKVVMHARDTVERGEPLSAGLLQQTVMPLTMVRMLQAGEKTGRIDEMMMNVADYYDQEIETTLAGLTSLLEPLLMVALGIIIGGIVIAMFMPIFQMPALIN